MHESIIIFFISCTALFAHASSNDISWQSNYKKPAYFAKGEQTQQRSNSPISPSSSMIEGYLIEIGNVSTTQSMKYIITGFKSYLKQKDIRFKSVIETDQSFILFIEKPNEINISNFYGDFARTTAWLLLNRRDTQATIRPIFKTSARQTFKPEQVLFLDAPKVIKGHYDGYFLDPEATIIDGFHIHMDYQEGQKDAAYNLKKLFESMTASMKLLYSDLDIYPALANGPHNRAGWEVKFERLGPLAFKPYGYALAWLMLNHGEVPIYSHSKSWLFGENEKRLISHLDNSLYSGLKPELNQWFFFDPNNPKSGLYRWDSQLPSVAKLSSKAIAEKQQAVYEFWFGKETSIYPEARSKNWFRRQHQTASAYDKIISTQFQNDISLYMNGYYREWESSPKGILSAIVLVDQFPRNIYRGQRMAFAYDEEALRLSKLAIKKGFHTKLTHTERLFVYMPLVHSENKENQALGVKLIRELEVASQASEKHHFEGYLLKAKQHQAIIDHFGYFPSRKPNYGQSISTQERAFMQQHDGQF